MKEQNAITDLIFDFFGTLVGYSAHKSFKTGETKTHQYLLSKGYEISYEDFVNSFENEFNALEVEALTTYREYHLYDVGRQFFLNSFNTKVENTILEELIDIYLEEWNQSTIYFPRIKELINKLAKRYRLSIISNTYYPKSIVLNLDNMEISDLFAQIITSIEFGYRKPDTKIFTYSLSQLGIVPTASIYIGDSYEADYIGAKKAGMKCLLIDEKKNHMELGRERVNNLFELEDILI